jgi:hypothetical protein
MARAAVDQVRVALNSAVHQAQQQAAKEHRAVAPHQERAPSRLARMSVAYGCIVATKVHPFGGGIIAHRRRSF